MEFVMVVALLVLVILPLAWKALTPKPDLAAIYLFNRDYLEDWRKQVEEGEAELKDLEFECEECCDASCESCEDIKKRAAGDRSRYELANGYFKTYGELPERLK